MKFLIMIKTLTLHNHNKELHNISSFNVNNGIPLDKQFDCTVIILFLVGLSMAG